MCAIVGTSEDKCAAKPAISIVLLMVEALFMLLLITLSCFILLLLCYC